jgi:hypothetical protein
VPGLGGGLHFGKRGSVIAGQHNIAHGLFESTFNPKIISIAFNTD